MRFGAPLFGTWKNPEGWVKLLRSKGFDAAICPVGLEASDAEIAEYRQAAAQNDIVIAEVGAWGNNPLHPDRAVADAAFAGMVQALALADKIKALCCVNIVGSRGERWDGPHPLNLTRETYDSIIAYVKRLLNEVQPKSTAYTLEMMPWMYPTTAAETLQMIRDVGMPGFAAHVDMVNITCSPRLYYENAQATRECFRVLGPHIRSVHAKDIKLADELTVHLSEVRAGLGGFDYQALLASVLEYCPDAPVMLEHLDTEAEYDQASEYVRGVADSLKIAIARPEGAR